ncbi:MAG: hypothetical protein FWD18_08975 [Micrococcales bacterium]|nr:hypothetical protein [Micrococcales bacterium]
MSVTYDQAAEIAYGAGLDGWDSSLGTFLLDDRDIIEDDEVFVFVVGSREHLIDRNPRFFMAGGGSGVVSKTDGTIEWIPWHFLQEMRPGLVERPNPSPVYFHR